MMFSKFTNAVILVCVIGLLITLGCSKPKFILLDPAFSETPIESIVLLSVVDRRPDKTVELDLEKDIRQRCKDKLEGRGYVVELFDGFVSGNSAVTAENVAIMTDEELFPLGPQNRDNILVVFIDDCVKKKSLFKFQSKLETTGVLLNKNRQVILWKARGIGEYSSGGILGSLIDSAIFSSEAVKRSIDNLFASLPKVEKK